MTYTSLMLIIITFFFWATLTVQEEGRGSRQLGVIITIAAWFAVGWVLHWAGTWISSLINT